MKKRKGEKDILDKKTLLKDLLPVASDLFTVTQNKQIVLNKFDWLNTRKGKHEFIQNLKKLKKSLKKENLYLKQMKKVFYLS